MASCANSHQVQEIVSAIYALAMLRKRGAPAQDIAQARNKLLALYLLVGIDVPQKDPYT